MFKSRLNILSILFGLSFAVIIGRLWQLQVIRHAKYEALTQRSRSLDALVPAIRGPIVDRFGNVLAEDRPFFDLSVRVDRLRLKQTSVDDVQAARALPEGPERNARFDRLRLELRDDPFVRDLARTLKRSDEDIAGGLLKALDTVARKWASPRTPVRIASGIDEDTWLSLRAAHEDIFRDSRLLFGPQAEKLSDPELPPFPGLICTVSTRRVYPQGRLGGVVIGGLGELSADDEEYLRHDGVLLENEAARARAWVGLRSKFDDDSAVQLERLIGADPRTIEDLGELYERLVPLRTTDRQLAARLGLSEPVRWLERPPRMKLNEAELQALGVGEIQPTHRGVLIDHVIGEMGFERVQNDRLRGRAGIKQPEYSDDDESADEQTLRRSLQPRRGETLALTISTPWQSAVERAIASQDRCGAIVVLDVHTGEVLAMTSYPNFDPNLFVPPRDRPEQREKLKALLADPNKPLLNRAISEQYPLGSVMKTLVAAAALQLGKVNTTETFECPGFIKLGNQTFHCDGHHAHGTVNVVKGIRVSCNVTFHQIGARIGVENLGQFARLLMGRRTGIDLPGEAAGIYPDREWRTKYAPGSIWTTGQDYLLAIGQGQLTCTVLQSTVLMAAISNGGSIVTPRVWLDGPQPAPISLGIADSNLAYVREGLWEVVNVNRAGERGTAYAAFHEQGSELAIQVAGKTSTAEHGRSDKPHAWFAGYAPAENPQVAFSVMLEDAGHGGAVAAPIAYKFLKEVYGTRSAPVKNPGGPKDAEPVAEASGR